MPTNLQLRTTAPLDRLATTTNRAQQTIASAKAPATRRAYQTAWRGFVAYAESIGKDSLPADPETVALYMNDRAFGPSPVAVSTIAVDAAAVKHAHDAGGFLSPTIAPIVVETLKGIRRELGGKVRRKKDLSIDALEAMVTSDGTRPLDKRDRALLAVGLFGAFRRSELIGLDRDDVEFDARGATITLRRSKTDQTGEGSVKVLPYRPSPSTCPVALLRSWLSVRGDTPGPLFQSISKKGTLSGRRLSGIDVARILHRRAAVIGLDSIELGGHSLRIGFVTEARRKGASTLEIQAQTGHKTDRMIATYTRREDAWEMNAVTRL